MAFLVYDLPLEGSSARAMHSGLSGPTLWHSRWGRHNLKNREREKEKEGEIIMLRELRREKERQSWGGGCNNNHQRKEEKKKTRTHTYTETQKHTEWACSHSSETLSTWPHWEFARVCVCACECLCTTNSISATEQTEHSCVHKRMQKRGVKVGPQSVALEICACCCGGGEGSTLNPQKTSNVTAFSPWQSEIAVIHSSIALLWLLWQGETFPWQLLSLSVTPPSTPHFSVSLLHMFQDYPQSSVLLAPGLTCGGGKKMETQEARQEKRKKKKPRGTCKLFPRHPLLTARHTPLSESWQTVNLQIKANDSCAWQFNKTLTKTIAQ